MPLAPQIVITPITVTSSGMTTSSVDGVYSLNTASPAFKTTETKATDAKAKADQALADAAAAQAAAVTASQTATTAQETADGKNTVWYSTKTPSWTVGVNGASGNGSVVTYSTSGAHGLFVGQPISISGITPSQYNLASATVASIPSSTQFTVASSATGSYSSGGTVSANTPNKAGDIWFQRDVSTQKIVAQYTGAGGTSWTSVKVDGAVLANIDAGTITTGTLSANIYIQGPIIRTASSGARVQLDSNGLVAYNSSGSPVTSISASTGAITASGGTFSGNITSSSGTIGGFDLYSYMLSNSSSTVRVFSDPANQGGFALLASYDIQGRKVNASSSADDALYSGGGLSVFGKAVIGGNMAVSGQVYMQDVYNQQAGTSANVFVGSNGRLTRLASSARYKENITDIRDVPGLEPEALYDLPVRAFSYKPGSLIEGDDREGLMVPGFIAEEVAEHYPLGADYSDGVPEMWNVHALVPAMLALIQQQAKTIADLQSRVEALEARP